MSESAGEIEVEKENYVGDRAETEVQRVKYVEEPANVKSIYIEEVSEESKDHSHDLHYTPDKEADSENTEEKKELNKKLNDVCTLTEKCKEVVEMLTDCIREEHDLNEQGSEVYIEETSEQLEETKQIVKKAAEQPKPKLKIHIKDLKVKSVKKSEKPERAKKTRKVEDTKQFADKSEEVEPKMEEQPIERPKLIPQPIEHSVAETDSNIQHEPLKAHVHFTYQPKLKAHANVKSEASSESTKDFSARGTQFLHFMYSAEEDDLAAPEELLCEGSKGWSDCR